MKIKRENSEIKIPNYKKGENLENLPSYYFASHFINKIQFQNLVNEDELNFLADPKGWKLFISSLIEEYIENERHYLDLKYRTNLFYFEQLGANQL